MATRTSAPRPAPIPSGVMTIEVHFKTALSTPPVVERLDWPIGWPLPGHGDSIMVGTSGGFVTHLSFHPDRNIVVVNTR